LFDAFDASFHSFAQVGGGDSDALFYTLVQIWHVLKARYYEEFLMGRIVLVTGAARSGKSEWAERLAARSGKQIVYVATAQRYEGDLDWDARIDQHIARRPTEWRSLEVPLELAGAIDAGLVNECFLIDSLGSWVGNGLEMNEMDWRSHCEHLMGRVNSSVPDLIFVAEETGWGVIPAYPMGRLFRDRLGRLIRALGQRADQTFLVVAGFAVDVQKIGVAIDLDDLK
jgi:adenosylcobinamide kinase / adenosylcobinamide-phosphate guanylyltransferase